MVRSERNMQLFLNRAVVSLWLMRFGRIKPDTCHSLLLTLMTVCLILMPSPVVAAADPVIATAAGQKVTSVTVDFELVQFDQVRTGDQFSLALPSPHGLIHLTAIVTHDDVYINGDRVLYAEEATDQQLPPESLTIVITLGAHSILADIRYANMRFAFEGQRLNGRVRGRLSQVSESNTPAVHLPSDFVVPDVLTRDGLSRPAVDQVPSPLRLSAPDSQSDSPVMPVSESHLPGVMASSVLEISQSFDRFAVFTQETAEIEVTIRFRNTGSQVVSGLTADVIFILEDTELINAPACIQTASNTVPRQPILRCALPGQLTAGSSRSISYTVRVPAKTAAMRLWSTVLSGSQPATRCISECG